MNTQTLNKLGDPTNTDLYKKILSILDSKDKIPYITKIHQYYYNFWQDENHPRGIWRRISNLEDFKKDIIPWEIVLDIDKLGKEENESWVYKGYVLYQHDKSSSSDKKTINDEL